MEKKVGQEEKKGLLEKLKDGMDDKEEQLAILSTFVRLGILFGVEEYLHWHISNYHLH